MSEELPPPEHLQYSRLAYAVRVALVEIGFEYRAGQQWKAWELQRRLELQRSATGSTT